jgi:hypothetical protein
MQDVSLAALVTVGASGAPGRWATDLGWLVKLVKALFDSAKSIANDHRFFPPDPPRKVAGG